MGVDVAPPPDIATRCSSVQPGTRALRGFHGWHRRLRRADQPAGLTSPALGSRPCGSAPSTRPPDATAPGRLLRRGPGARQPRRLRRAPRPAAAAPTSSSPPPGQRASLVHRRLRRPVLAVPHLYVWSRDDTSGPATTGHAVFPVVQKEPGCTTRRPAPGIHRFDDFEPDLNICHPDVRAEILKIAAYWIRLGVSGFRMTRPRSSSSRPRQDTDAPPPRDYAFLVQLREELSWNRGNAVLLAEANVPDDQLLEFPSMPTAPRPGPHAVRVPAEPGADAGARPRGRVGVDRQDGAGHAGMRATGNGRRSCATTTRWTCPTERGTSGPTSSPPSGRIDDQLYWPGHPSPAGADARWGTGAGSGWPTACSSRCRVPPFATATSSAWVRTG